MNLFDNILAKANPLPDVKSQFMSGFQQPQQKKPSMTLFSDEYTMLGKMKADGLSDEESMNLLKQRRTDLLEGRTNLDPKEQSMLLKMQADKLSAKEATALLKQRRADQFEKKYQEGNLLQKGAYNTLMAGAGNLETVLKYGGNALDFVTFGQLGFGEDVKRMEQVTQSPEFDSTAFKAGTYLPDVALGVSPIGAGYLAGAKGMGQLALRSGVVGAGFGATQPILEQGSDVSAGDIATGAAVGAGLGVVATPVLAKTFKYGKAGYYGGLEGAGKSIARDVKAGVQAITPSGANISTKANRFNASEIRNFIKMTGQTPGDFATSRGMTKVGDDAVVEATNLWQASKDQADEALKAIKGRFRFTDGGEDLLKTTLDDLETRLINTKSPDAKRISQLKAKYESSGLTMSEINEVKRAYSNNYKYSFVDAGSEGALRSRNLQDAIRKWQFKVAGENGFTNLKDINKTTQGWKAFADSLAKKIQGSSGNNAVSLTDWIALSGGNPENIALYLGKKLATSDRTKALAIKLFSKKTKPSIIQASKADIQQANFQKNVNRGVSGVGDNSGGKSLVRPVGLLPPPSGKATGARNFRANQPTEKTPITNEGQVGKRPTSQEPAAPVVKPSVKPPKKVVAPKKEAIVKKEATKVNKDIFDEETRDAIFVLQPKGYNVPKNADIYPSESGIGVSYKGKGGVNFYISTKDGKIKVSTDGLGANQIDFIQDAWKRVGKNMEEMHSNPVKPNPPTNEQQVSKPISGDTIPEGYTTNMFGEVIKKPSNSKGGFIRIGSEKPKTDIDSGLMAEAKKYKSAEEFIGDVLAQDYQISKNPGSRAFNVKVKLGGNRANELNNDSLKKIVEIAKINKTYDKEFQESVDSLLSNDSEVTIYRAAPIGKSININDYVTLSKNEADKYMRVSIFNPNKIREGYKIYEMKVKKEDLLQQGKNSMYFTYFPKSKESQLRQIYEQANSPKPIVKNLQKTEKSDMETKKLIEPIKGVNFTRLKGLIEDIKSNNGGQKGVLGDFLEGNEMKKIYGDALDTPVYIFDESHPVFKTAENINKEGTPRAMTAFIEGGKLSNKGTPIIAIRGKISVDGLIKTLTEEGIHALQKLKGRKRIGSATAKNFSEYEGNANEINANKGASYAMKIINRK